MRLSLIAAVVVSCSIPLPAFAWTEITDQPQYEGVWTPPRPMPFKKTPAGFTEAIHATYPKLRVQSVEGCGASFTPARVTHFDVIDDLWFPARDAYGCDRVYYESTDPRGTQRCMGQFQFMSEGTTPTDKEPSQSWYEKTLKNDCRWL